MAMKRFAVGYEFLCRIIMMIFVVHVAFLAHTLLGLVLVGFFPSVAATCTTYRTWLLDLKDRSWTVRQTWMTFHRAWRSELAAANRFGWPQLLVWALLIWEYWLTMTNDMGALTPVVSGLLLLLNLLYGLFVLLSWPVRSNFDESPLWAARTALSMVAGRPLCSLMVLALLMITGWAYYTWPGLAVTFGLAAPLFADMAAVYSWGRLPGMDVHVLEPAKKQVSGSGSASKSDIRSR